MKNKPCLKIVIAHACTFAVTSSFAFMPNTTNNKPHWYVGITGLYMRPSNVNYGETLAGPLEPTTLVKTDYQPAVSGVLGYFLTDLDDLSVNYTYSYFNDSHSSFSSAPPTIDDPTYNAENTNYKVNYNAIAFSLGHYINTQRWSTHLYGGLDYTNIKQHATIMRSYPDFTLLGIPTPVPQNLQQTVLLKGIGPQVGFESGFKLTNEFSLKGGANLAILATQLSSSILNQSVREAGEGGLLPGQASVAGNARSAAFKTQINLGLGYEKVIKNDYRLSVELGYKAVLVQNQVGPDGGEGSFARHNRYSFSMHGPYLGFGVSC
jgi:hypothetical protein